MRKTLLLLTLLLAIRAEAQTISPAPYCPNEYDDGAAAVTHYISSFSIGSFTNTSGPVQQPFPHYIYYNNLSPIYLQQGAGIPYNIQFDPDNNKTVAFFIEYNQDGYIDPINELIYYSNVAAGVTSVSSVFFVPYSSNIGLTRLRLMVYEDNTINIPQTCTNTVDWGETEDYEVEIGIVSSVNEVNTHFGISLYPNPVSDQIHLSLSGVEASEIIIYNSASQVLYKSKIENNNEFTIDFDYPSGIYFVSVLTDNGWCNKRFTVEK